MKRSTPPLLGAAALLALLALTALDATPRAAAVDAGASDVLARGRALVAFGACNDCHTPGWRDSDAMLPAERWMTGSAIGFRGPWGTAYPANVRLRFQQIDEEQWLAAVRTRGGHPPMTWHDVRSLSDADQRAIYRFIRALGPAGTPAPKDLGPDDSPTTPYVELVPATPAP
ncbi:MAG TPA: hypothetical protein VMD91_15885 [Candidatus Sulfotelmatobacter sp.]|nr:hypothetical protein [Candidatus Sulfotelmatobacter sp.]